MQFNAPLVSGDRFLNIVPGSHLRASTAAEIEASRSESGDMPNAHVVESGTGRHRLLQRQPLAPGLEPGGTQALDHALRLLECWEQR